MVEVVGCEALLAKFWSSCFLCQKIKREVTGIIEKRIVKIEQWRNAIDFNKKDRAKRYHKFSLFTFHFSLFNIQFGSGFARLGGN